MAIQGREGLCYRYVYDLAKESMDNDTDHEIEVVHGRAVDPVSGTTIQNHAWIEYKYQDNVVDPTISDGILDKSWYYAVYRPTPERRYTPEEIILLAMRNRFVGKYHTRSSQKSTSILKRAQKMSGVRI